MPIDLKRYPPNWADISHRIRFVRAGGRCEGGTHYPEDVEEHIQNRIRNRLAAQEAAGQLKLIKE